MTDFSNIPENNFLAKAYRGMIRTDICFPKDNSRQDGRYTECIDLAENVFNGMPEEIKEYYKTLLACIFEMKHTNVNDPDCLKKIYYISPAQASMDLGYEKNLGCEIEGVFEVIQGIVRELQEIRRKNGKDWFSITEDEVKTAMGIENLDDILDAIYYPKTEIAQRYFDKVKSNKSSMFGTNPLITESTKGRTR